MIKNIFSNKFVLYELLNMINEIKIKMILYFKN